MAQAIETHPRGSLPGETVRRLNRPSPLVPPRDRPVPRPAPQTRRRAAAPVYPQAYGPAPAREPARSPAVEVRAAARELRDVAQRCRCFADACERTAQRLEAGGAPPDPDALGALPEVVKVTKAVPEFFGFDMASLAVPIEPDWGEEGEPTRVRGRIEEARTWEMPVVEAGSVAATIPPPELQSCPGCGHRNGLQYSSCMVCGHQLRPTLPPPDAEPEPFVAPPGIGARIAAWLRRVDPRRPRWMNPAVIDRVSVPAIS